MGPLGTNIAGTPLSRMRALQQYNAVHVLFFRSILFQNENLIGIVIVAVMVDW